MAALYGKGIWVLYSANLGLALEMAKGIGATHILCKTGHRAMFLPEAARQARDRVRAAGRVPFAWHFIHCDDPAGEARVALKTAEIGYEGIIFHVGDQTAGQHTNAKELGQRLCNAGLNPQMLYYSSFPDISRHSSIPYAEMNVFCKGGFMPWSYPTFLKPAEVVIHKMTYEEHAKWSRVWGHSVPIYPVLAGYRDRCAQDRLAPGEFARWGDVLAERGPTFFSVFHAAVTDRDLWPTLARLAMPRPPEAVVVESIVPPKPALLEALVTAPVPEPGEGEGVYVTVRPDDTVRELCQKYGCTRAQFWEWNGHLWDERGMPRDPDYMQAGWRVRVK